MEDGGPEWIRCLRSDWLSNSRQNTEKGFLVEGVPFPGRQPGHWWSLAQGPAPKNKVMSSHHLAFGVEGTVDKRIQVLHLGEGVTCQNLFLCDTHVSEPVCVTHMCAEKALRPRMVGSHL